MDYFCNRRIKPGLPEHKAQYLKLVNGYFSAIREPAEMGSCNHVALFRTEVKSWIAALSGQKHRWKLRLISQLREMVSREQSGFNYWTWACLDLRQHAFEQMKWSEFRCLFCQVGRNLIYAFPPKLCRNLRDRRPHTVIISEIS
jgi:hypothetical protein